MLGSIQFNRESIDIRFLQNGRTPQGTTGTWVQAEGGKGGGEPARETAVDEGMRSGAQGQASEADGWRVRSTFQL